MSWLRGVDPSMVPAGVAARGEIPVWRERILQSLLLLTALAAIFVFALAIPRVVHARDWTSLALTSLAFLLVVILPFLRSTPYLLRTWLIIGIFYGLALHNLLVWGVTRNASLYFLAVIVWVGLLLGIRAGIAAIILTFLSLSALAGSMNSGLISQPMQAALLASQQTANWISVAVHMGFLGGFVLIAIYIITQNLSASLESQRSLNERLNQVQRSLTETVEIRTAELDRRLRQLRAASAVSRAISTFLDPRSLLQRVVNLIQETFGYYYVGAFIIDDNGSTARLEAGSGDAGRAMVAFGHVLAVGGNSMVGWAAANMTSRIALDTGQEAVRFNNPFLPDTRSEMALPIISRGRCLGVLTIQSDQPEAFDQDDISILEGIADSVAIALENAQLFEQTRQSLDQVRALNQTFTSEGWHDLQALVGDIEFTHEDTTQGDHHGLSSQVDIPLLVREEIIGNLSLDIPYSNLSPEDEEFIQSITNQTAIALENARLIRQTQRRAFLEQKLSQITSSFSQSATTQQIIKTALKELSSLPEISSVSLRFTPPDAGTTSHEVPQ